MKLVSHRRDGRARLGAVVGEHVVDLEGDDLVAFLRAGKPAREAAADVLTRAQDPEALRGLAARGAATPVGQVSFLPVVQRPAKIICLGHNYRHHVMEMGGAMPEYPVLFGRFAHTLIGHRQPIVLPTVSQMVDYEAELAIVIGRRGRAIAQARAFDHIAGYTCFNDVSVRDYQRRTVQWMQGKNFDGTGPLGPALVTLDEIGDPSALPIRLRLNGQVMQESNTSDFIFSVPRIIEYVSEILTLEEGDVIATGTPSGVGAARKPPVFLRPGDRVEVEIGGVGLLENPVA
jgi:acylpyruvate hydrolase